MGIVIKDLSFSFNKLSIIESFSLEAKKKEIVLIKKQKRLLKLSLSLIYGEMEQKLEN